MKSFPVHADLGAVNVRVVDASKIEKSAKKRVVYVNLQAATGGDIFLEKVTLMDGQLWKSIDFLAAIKEQSETIEGIDPRKWIGREATAWLIAEKVAGEVSYKVAEWVGDSDTVDQRYFSYKSEV